MDGIHDLGGKQGFGTVVRETDEPVFHARWESRVFGLNLVGDALSDLANPRRTDRSGRVA